MIDSKGITIDSGGIKKGETYKTFRLLRVYRPQSSGGAVAEQGRAYRHRRLDPVGGRAHGDALGVTPLAQGNHVGACRIGEHLDGDVPMLQGIPQRVGDASVVELVAE